MNSLPPEIVSRWLYLNKIPVTATRAEVYQWNLPTGETKWYSIDAAQYGIDLLKIQPREIVTPQDASLLLSRNPSAPNPDSPAVDAADLSRPVIIGTMDTPEGLRHTLIDGWHRISKAVKTGCTDTLKAYILPPELTEACRITTTQDNLSRVTN